MGVLLALGTALSFSVMNLSIRKGARAESDDNGVLATLIVNMGVFTLLLVVAAWTGGLREIKPDAAVAFMSIGLTGAFLGRTFLFAGIRRIGVVRASAIKSGAPIATLLIAIVWIGERFTLLDSFGIALTLAGVFLVVRESLIGSGVPPAAQPHEPLASSVAADRRLLTGVALALLSAVAFGTSNALSKVAMNIVPDAIQAGAFAGWAALAAYLASAVLRRELAVMRIALIARRPWLWLAGVAGAFGQLSFFAALHFAPVAHVTVVAASEIILTTLLGGLLAQQLEQVTRRIAAPAILVFAGAALIGLSR